MDFEARAQIEELKRILAEVKKLAEDAKHDIDYFNEVKLPALADELSKKVDSVKQNYPTVFKEN